MYLVSGNKKIWYPGIFPGHDRSMDATIEHTPPKWPKLQVVTAIKRRNIQ